MRDTESDRAIRTTSDQGLSVATVPVGAVRQPELAEMGAECIGVVGATPFMAAVTSISGIICTVFT